MKWKTKRFTLYPDDRLGIYFLPKHDPNMFYADHPMNGNGEESIPRRHWARQTKHTSGEELDIRMASPLTWRLINKVDLSCALRVGRSPIVQKATFTYCMASSTTRGSHYNGSHYLSNSSCRDVIISTLFGDFLDTKINPYPKSNPDPNPNRLPNPNFVSV